MQAPAASPITSVALTSSFPHTDRALRQLRLDGDKVHLPAGSRLFPIKNIDGLRAGPDLKVDRQARVLVADFGGRTEALLVENAGAQEITFHFAGDVAADLFHVVHRLWTECPTLSAADLPGRA